MAQNLQISSLGAAFTITGEHSGFSSSIAWNLSSFKQVRNGFYSVDGESLFNKQGLFTVNHLFEDFDYGNPEYSELSSFTIQPNIPSPTNKPQFFWQFVLPRKVLLEQAQVTVILEVHAFQDVGDEEFKFLSGWDVQPYFTTIMQQQHVVFIDQSNTDHFLTYRMIFRGETYPSITDNRVRVLLTCNLKPGRTSEDEQLLFGCHLSYTIIVDRVQGSLESGQTRDSAVQVYLDPPSPPFVILG